jgi:putative lipoprotein (rSAM/lipoprotein system)
MKKPIIKSFDKIIVMLLSIVGIFSACSTGATKYGTPSATYEIKGTITDKETSRPIKHIQIITQTNDYHKDTLYTDSYGQYYYKFWDFPLGDKPVHLKFEDIDGEENWGDFATQEIDVIFTKEDQIIKGKDEWDEGTFEKIQNIKLEKKK